MIILTRCVAFVAVLLLGLILPWWVFLILVVIGSCVFPQYVEGIIIGALLDALLSNSFEFAHWYLVIGLALYAIGLVMRRYLFV